MKKGNNIRVRSDGRYEARYTKGRDDNGKIIYGYCYGRTYEEAEEKRDWQIQKLQALLPRRMNLLLLGAGSHGEEVFEIATKMRCFSKISFLDDNKTDYRIVGKCENFSSFFNEFSIAFPTVGDNSLRKEWIDELSAQGFIIPTLIDPSAVISSNSTIGYGTVICAGAVVNSGAVIGNGCIVSSGAIIARDARMDDYMFINSGQTLLRNGEIR